jgi:Reverse transcriptase (RNA-dependent DNA polymerase)
LQGSVLSPWLFNLYLDAIVNDSPITRALIAEKRLLAYADDMVVFNESEAEMNISFKALQDSMARYGLSINTKKCELLTKLKIKESMGV